MMIVISRLVGFQSINDNDGSISVVNPGVSKVSKHTLIGMDWCKWIIQTMPKWQRAKGFDQGPVRALTIKRWGDRDTIDK